LINPLAVKEFLSRPLRSFAWMKSLSEDEVDRRLAAVRPRPIIHPNMRLDQKVCFLIGLTYPQFYFMVEMGVGKTFVTIELLRYWIGYRYMAKAIVLVPTEEVAWGWMDELEKWTGMRVPGVVLTDSTSNKWDLVEACNKGLMLMTFQGMFTMVSDRAKRHRKVQKGNMSRTVKGYSYVHNPKYIASLCQDVGALVVDEVTKLGNNESMWFRVAWQISRRTWCRYALAGRPFGRDPVMLWPEFKLVDHGETLGQTIGLFRSAFYAESKNQFARNKYAKSYSFRSARQPQLSRMLENRSIVYTSAECIKLPAVSRLKSQVRFPVETAAYYQKMVAQVIAAQGNYSVMKNAFMRMRQVSSGFLGFRDDETGDKAEIEFQHNPKLDDLMGKLEVLPPGAKWVVFYEFNWSGRKISEALKKAKIPHGQVAGGTKDYRALKRRFDTDPAFPGLLVNCRKGAYGLNLQVASYTFFYESPISPIDRDQAERRTIRGGQKAQRVFLYDLVMKGSMDERILDFHREGNDLFAALVRNPAAVVRKVSQGRQAPS